MVAREAFNPPQPPTAADAVAGNAARIVFGMLLAVTACIVAAGGATAAQPADAEIRERIAQLSDPSFAVRETATRELLRLGTGIRPLLVEALDHRDAEIRQRVRQLLHTVMKEDLRKRLNRFATGDSKDDAEPLPGWSFYRQTVGDDVRARAHFVEALSAEPILLESLGQESAYIGRTIQSRTQSLYQDLIRNPGRNSTARSGPGVSLVTPTASVAALLIVAADPQIPIDEQTAQKIFQLMQHSGYTQQLASDPKHKAARSLVGHFVRRSVGTSLSYQMLWLAMQCNLKDGLVPAEAIVRDEAQQPYVLQNAMLAIAKLGDRQHLQLLQPFLKNETPVNNRRAAAGYLPQVRDVALAATIHLHGQNPRQFGFRRIRPNPQTLFQAGTMGFESSQNRQAAFDKWDQWLTEQKSKTSRGQP